MLFEMFAPMEEWEKIEGTMVIKKMQPNYILKLIQKEKKLIPAS